MLLKTILLKLFKFLIYSAFFFICLIAFWLVFLKFKSATNDAVWQTQYKVLADAEIGGDTISIKNLRDFRYNEDESIKAANYLDKTYQLSEMKDIWYGISHFGKNGLAHVFISFEFIDAAQKKDYLTVSIEARLKEKSKNGYNPFAGLFGLYNKTIVLSTEQDVIGLRTHIRKEQVYLYRLTIPELNEKALLLSFLRNVDSLHRQPELYNSILDNCMTGLLAQSKYFDKKPIWMDKRILLPGNSDEVAYELDFIDTTRSFSELREIAKIDPALMELEATDFSEQIRLGQ